MDRGWTEVPNCSRRYPAHSEQGGGSSFSAQESLQTLHQLDLSRGIVVCQEEVAVFWEPQLLDQANSKDLTQRQGEDGNTSVCWTQGLGQHFLVVRKHDQLSRRNTA